MLLCNRYCDTATGHISFLRFDKCFRSTSRQTSGVNALRVGLASFLVLGLLTGQQMQAAEVAAPQASASAIPTTWYDLSTRGAAVNAWNDFAPSRSAPMGFTGNVAGHVAGTTS